LAACKARFRSIAASRSKTFVIDRLRNDETAHNGKESLDATHVSDVFARAMELDIAWIATRAIR